jgi:hypothetical protein
MPDDKVYSNNLWDYLEDMPYLPSRRDRDELVQTGEEKRVFIWDYFFRIIPAHVGKPQKIEIENINKDLFQKIQQYKKTRESINEQIADLERGLFQIRVKNFFYGIGGFVFSAILYKTFSNYATVYSLSIICVMLPIIYGIVMWTLIGLGGRKEKRDIRYFRNEFRLLIEDYFLYTENVIARKNILRTEIKLLKDQIPSSCPNDMVRKWLNEDFKHLYEKSKEVTALSNRLINIEADESDATGNPLVYPNPIPVLGPGELQHPKKIPLTFSKSYNSDLNKHLTAKQSFYMENDSRYEVLYGVYYLEHILIADDMLATYGLFYDFISGKCHAEQITEQYYQDVVAITTTHEFRKIHLSIGDKQTRYIEDAPTFTLSLASGEHRTVTFVSKKYFMEIKENLNITEDDISRIYWIGRSQMDAEKAGKALRAQLRQHKIILQDE